MIINRRRNRSFPRGIKINNTRIKFTYELEANSKIYDIIRHNDKKNNLNICCYKKIN